MKYVYMIFGQAITFACKKDMRVTYLLVLSSVSTFRRNSLFSLEHVSTLWKEKYCNITQ